MITEQGVVPTTSAEYLDTIKTTYEAELAARGLPSQVDWERDTFMGIWAPIIADRLGDLAESDQFNFDMMDPGAARGVYLDMLCWLVGIYREAPTRSTAVVTLTGTPGALIPAGALVEGGGADGRARWQLLATVTIGGGGTVQGEIAAQMLGRIDASAGEINKIVTIQMGWTGVTNAASAVPGNDIESDEDLRARRQRSIQTLAGPSLGGIRAAVEALPDVTSAQVFDNVSDAEQVIAGITLTPKTICVVVYPEQDTAEKREALAILLARKRAAGIGMAGDQSETVIGEGISDSIIRWQHAEEVEVDVAITLTLASGVTVESVELAVEQAVGLVFAAAKVGDAVRRLAILARLASIPGILSADVLLAGVAADFTPTLIQRPLAGAINIT